MAGEQSDLRWVHGLQRKLGVQPSGRQTFDIGFEPVSEIYRCASAELFGTVVLVLTTGFAISAAGEAIHATIDIYPYDTAAANVPPGNTLAELGPQGVLSVAVAVSSVVMMLLFLFSRVSGGHFNCAITLAFMMQKRISSKRGFIYMLAQFLGSFAGGILLKVFVPSTAESCLGAPALGSTTSVWSGLFLEFTFSLLLVLVYLTRMHPGELLPHPFKVNVSEDPGGNGAAMIASVYLVGTLCLLPFTGASMNPTRIFGQQMFSKLDCDSFSSVWVYWAGPMGAAVLGPMLHDVWFPPVGSEGDTGQPDMRPAARETAQPHYDQSDFSSGGRMDSLEEVHIDDSQGV